MSRHLYTYMGTLLPRQLWTATLKFESLNSIVTLLWLLLSSVAVLSGKRGREGVGFFPNFFRLASWRGCSLDSCASFISWWNRLTLSMTLIRAPTEDTLHNKRSVCWTRPKIKLSLLSHTADHFGCPSLSKFVHNVGVFWTNLMLFWVWKASSQKMIRAESENTHSLTSQAGAQPIFGDLWVWFQWASYWDSVFWSVIRARSAPPNDRFII